MVTKHSAAAAPNAGKTGGVRDLARRRVHGRARGFSLVELIVVAVIIICVTALALPSLTGMATSVKLRGGMGDLSGLLQTCRSQAVKQNQTKFVHFQTSSAHLVAYLDNAASPNGAPVSGLPQLWLPTQFTRVPEPAGGDAPTALDLITCGGNDALPQMCSDTDSSCDAYFNSMGIPCKYVSAGNCQTGWAFAYYFNYAASLGATKWSAVCVSPAGRIKNWYWDGSQWSD